MENTYAVVLAGGSGTRFWPLSREKSPKQVLNIINANSLVENTINRILNLIPKENVRVVTNAKQQKLMKPLLPMLSDRSYVLEPFPRNTAPCIGLAAMDLYKQDPNSIMVVLPSDHLIRDEEEFLRVITRGVELVRENDVLALIGIKPTRPATGYGYIQFDANNSEFSKEIKRVKTFAEKPNLVTAERFLKSGEFRWNAGIFIWKASTILKEMETYLNDIYHQLEHIFQSKEQKNFNRILSARYSTMKPISIDCGIMEVTRSPIYMLEGDFGWSDIGSWDELFRISDKDKDGNVVVGEGVTLNASNNYIHSPKKLTAVIGMDNVLVVNTKNALLICPIDKTEDVKSIVEKLRREEKKKYL